MKFKRDDLKNKKSYYFLLIVFEILLFFSLFYFKIHWVFILIVFPFFLIEIISNKRNLNRQKNFITNIEFKEDKIICTHFRGNKTEIPFEKTLFSFREIKFEKDKSEIEIKRKGKLKNKLIGRIHINNWKNIFLIKNEFVKNSITRVQFKPEGFWLKYAGFTADTIIFSSSLAFGEVAEILGDSDGAINSKNIASETNFKSLHKNHKKERS